MKFFTSRQISYCQWGILLAAAVWNFLKVFQFALDVPVEDDWDYLTAAGNWKDIFAVHVQHRIVFTRILFNLSYMVNSLNFRWLIIINWFVYGLFAFSVMLLFKKEIKSYPGFGLFSKILVIEFNVCIGIFSFVDSENTTLTFLLYTSNYIY